MIDWIQKPFAVFCGEGLSVRCNPCEDVVYCRYRRFRTEKTMKG